MAYILKTNIIKKLKLLEENLPLNKDSLKTTLWMLLCYDMRRGSFIYRCPKSFLQERGYPNMEKNYIFSFRKSKSNYDTFIFLLRKNKT